MCTRVKVGEEPGDMKTLRAAQEALRCGAVALAASCAAQPAPAVRPVALCSPPDSATARPSVPPSRSIAEPSNDGGVALRFTSDSRHVVLFTADAFSVHDATTGAVERREAFGAGRRLLAASFDASRAVLYDGTVLVAVDVASGARRPLPVAWTEDRTADDLALEVSLSADGRWLGLSSADDGGLRVRTFDLASLTATDVHRHEPISAGGVDADGIGLDGRTIEFVNSRVGTLLVDRTTDRAGPAFGPDCVRSPDGRWVVEFPDRTFVPEEEWPRLPKTGVVKDGPTGAVRGALALELADRELGGQAHGAFCGISDRFVSFSAAGLGMYEVPSGKRVWKAPAAPAEIAAPRFGAGLMLACSPDARRVAFVAGQRLTILQVDAR